MSWLIAQSLPSILLAVALGLLVGWLVWGTSWNKVRTTRREVLGQLVFTYQRERADRDSQLAVLRDELDEERAENHLVVEGLRRELDDCLGAQRTSVVPPTDVVQPGPAAAGYDDLQRIEGIGPKMAAALRAAEIETFQVLAQTSVERIQDAVHSAGLRFAPSLPSWPAQAALLAAGDDEAFHELTSDLVAGRGND